MTHLCCAGVLTSFQGSMRLGCALRQHLLAPNDMHTVAFQLSLWLVSSSKPS